ncbi:MAG TPA: hypothetical protein EYP17_04785 [Candidatus Latescibacteria bacterium]|nr:hypothetical protein [Candidatus Latescibacterota bacterium]
MGLEELRRPLVDAYARWNATDYHTYLWESGRKEGRPPSFQMARDAVRKRFHSVASTVEEWTCKTDSYWNFENGGD